MIEQFGNGGFAAEAIAAKLDEPGFWNADNDQWRTLAHQFSKSFAWAR